MRFLGVSCLFCVTLTEASAASPVIHDGSMGTGSAVSVNPVRGRYNILPDNGKPSGGNLFHSFSKFSVPEGTTASFLTNAGTERVIARVTGGEVSNIEGTLATPRAGTSVYLVNPAGFLFGSNAVLDVKGSFHAAAGDSISFLEENKTRTTLWVDPSKDLALSSAPVVSFGFVESGGEGEISVCSQLDSKGDFGLIGREVSIENAGVFAAGSVNLAAVGSESAEIEPHGKVAINPSVNGRITIRNSRISTGGAGTRFSMRSGDVLVNSSVVNFADVSTPVPSDLLIASSGSVKIENESYLGSISGDSAANEGIRLDVVGGLSLSNSAVQSISAGVADAPDLVIRSADLQITGNGGKKTLGIGSTSFFEGGVGDVRISVSGRMEIRNAGTIHSISAGSGDLGILEVESGTLEIVGIRKKSPENQAYLTGIVALTEGSGTNGNIHVNARDSIKLTQGGLIDSSTFGSGDGGSIRVESPSILIDRDGSHYFTGIGSDATSSGAAGSVRVNTNTLKLLSGGLISSSTETSGNAGDVNVTADELIARGYGDDTPYVFIRSSGIVAGTTSVSQNNKAGTGGSVTVHSRSISLNDGAEISSRSLGTGRAGKIEIQSETLRLNHAEIGVRAANADAGRLEITSSDSLEITGGLVTASAGGTGNGGNIRIHTNGALAIRDGGRIEAASTGEGKAGRVIIASASTLMTGGSLLSSNATGKGNAGGIHLSTGGIRVNNSEIGVRAANGNAGQLKISSSGSVDMTGGLITASAGGSGNGGNIRINTGGDLAVRNGGRIKAASTGKGNAGRLIIETSSTELASGSLLSSNATGQGNAGGITLKTGFLRVTDSKIGVKAAKADAGTLSITSGSDILLTNALLTAAAPGKGNGGNMSIDFKDTLSAIESRIIAEANRDGGNILIPTGTYTILDHSPLSANAVRGDGGNIYIGSDVFLANESPVSASSRFGTQGVVRIDPLVALSGSEGESAPPPLDVSDVLQPECTQRLPTDTGSFIITGKGGTPRAPGGYLPSIRLLSIQSDSE